MSIYFFRIQQRETVLRYDQTLQTDIVAPRENLQVGLDQRPSWPAETYSRTASTGKVGELLINMGVQNYI